MLRKKACGTRNYSTRKTFATQVTLEYLPCGPCLSPFNLEITKRLRVKINEGTRHCFAWMITYGFPCWFISPCSATEARIDGSSTNAGVCLSGRRGVSSGSGGRYRHRNNRRPTNTKQTEPIKRRSHPWIHNSNLLRSGATTLPADIAAME